jgi:hypothetical protein
LQNDDAAEKCEYCGGVELLPAEEVVGRDRLQDVSNLVLEAGDGVVRGYWEFDGADGRVRVFRREGLPPGEYGGGVEVALIGSQSFEDRAVSNGRRYYYRVVVEYLSRAGSPVLTPGVCGVAAPEVPPQPVEACQISFEQGVLHVKWTPPRLGAVRIYRTEERPEWRSGDLLPTDRLAGLGVLLKSSRLEGMAYDDRPPEKTAFYVPVTITGDLAVMGRPEFYVAAGEVSKLKARHDGSQIQLQWQWPAGCDLALVTWREDAHPRGPDDKTAHWRKVTRGEYQKQNGFRTPAPAKTRCYFVVYAAVNIDGEMFYSAGKSPGARYELLPRASLTVTYSISRGGWRGRRATIRLNSEKDVERLPDIVVVAGRGDLEPLSIEAGVEVGRVRGVSLRANVAASYPLSAKSLTAESRLRAFFSDPQPAGGMELRKDV